VLVQVVQVSKESQLGVEIEMRELLSLAAYVAALANASSCANEANCICNLQSAMPLYDVLLGLAKNVFFFHI
jgi:hypothetical protein